MSHLFIWILYWALIALFILTIYILTVRGQLYCAAIYVGHWWAVLKEEVTRSVGVIRKELDRSEVELDEHEQHIS
jgi:hypothetical protein